MKNQGTRKLEVSEALVVDLQSKIDRLQGVNAELRNEIDKKELAVEALHDVLRTVLVRLHDLTK